MNERIELADGTVVQNAYVVRLEENFIAIYIRGEHSFNEIYALFGTSERTSRMVSYQTLDVQTWVGFTTVKTIKTDDREAYVSLMK